MSLEQIQVQSGMTRAPTVAPLPRPQGAVLDVPPQNEEQKIPEQTGAIDAIDASAAVEIDPEDVGFIAEELNRSIAVLNSSVSFSIDEATDRTIIKVVDNDTGDVIRQVPPEVLLNLLQRMTEMVGLLVDERA